MENKAVRIGLLLAFLALLLAGAFSGGVIVGWALPNHPTSSLALGPLALPGAGTAVPSVSGTAQSGQTLDSLFKPFWQTWNIVHDQFVDQPVDDTVLMRGAIQGMLDALGDKHTSYMDPDQYKQSNSSLQGDYEGIGAWVDTTTDYVTIINPMPDSPAEKAGLKTGDQIIAVDGKDQTGIDGSIVLRSILGPSGTEVRLTIARKNTDKPFDVTIKRAHIVVPSVESKTLDNGLGYVAINTFGEKTDTELRSQLKSVLARNPKGLILDLRNNGGGYLNTAIKVVSQFLDSGVVMHEVYGDGRTQDYSAEKGGLATKIPLVVLVNEGTASASEITAGAIQDYGRGVLVGVTTYGKGSVQNWIELQDSQGAVRVTIARWLTPKNRQINEKGLEPDYKVEITEADVTAGKDPQLDKAIQLLTSGQVK